MLFCWIDDAHGLMIAIMGNCRDSEYTFELSLL